MAAIRWYNRAGAGDAAPLVLLHGFTGSPLSWAAVAQALPSERSVAALSLPGHHPAVPVARGFDANLDQVADNIARAGLTGCQLVGYSLGARTALGLAVRHPVLVATLTLIGVHPGLADEGARRARVAHDAAWIEKLQRAGLEAFIDAWERQPIFARQAHLPAPLRARQRAIRAGHDARALARSLAEMGLGAMPNYWPQLTALTMPVSWITGAEDAKFTALAEAGVAAMRAAGLHPNGLQVPRCGHNPLLEAPAALASLLGS
ncbi:MAG: 2-succinyl-6-hydroxy-2,4-cyclohexadiene-1-carboxy late synthase [Haliangiales bacterium]